MDFSKCKINIVIVKNDFMVKNSNYKFKEEKKKNETNLTVKKLFKRTPISITI